MKIVRAAGFLITLLAIAPTSFAGYKSQFGTVDILQSVMYASGDLGDVRASQDRTQLIGCYIEGFPGQTSYMACQATDAGGHYAYCYSYDTSFMQAVAAISGDSSISFMWNAQGQCTYLVVDQASYLAPKVP